MAKKTKKTKKSKTVQATPNEPNQQQPDTLGRPELANDGVQDDAEETKYEVCRFGVWQAVTSGAPDLQEDKLAVRTFLAMHCLSGEDRQKAMKLLKSYGKHFDPENVSASQAPVYRLGLAGLLTRYAHAALDGTLEGLYDPKETENVFKVCAPLLNSDELALARTAQRRHDYKALYDILAQNRHQKSLFWVTDKTRCGPGSTKVVLPSKKDVEDRQLRSMAADLGSLQDMVENLKLQVQGLAACSQNAKPQNVTPPVTAEPTNLECTRCGIRLLNISGPERGLPCASKSSVEGAHLWKKVDNGVDKTALMDAVQHLQDAVDAKKREPVEFSLRAPDALDKKWADAREAEFRAWVDEHAGDLYEPYLATLENANEVRQLVRKATDGDEAAQQEFADSWMKFLRQQFLLPADNRVQNAAVSPADPKGALGGSLEDRLLKENLEMASRCKDLKAENEKLEAQVRERIAAVESIMESYRARPWWKRLFLVD